MLNQNGASCLCYRNDKWKLAMSKTGRPLPLPYRSVAYSTGLHHWPTSLAYITGLHHWPISLAYITGLQHWPTALAYSTALHHCPTSLPYLYRIYVVKSLLVPPSYICKPVKFSDYCD